MGKILDKLREDIDIVDEQLLDLLKLRQKIVEQLGEEKVIMEKPIHDLEREESLICNLRKKCENEPLLAAQIEEIWRTIMEVSRKKQEFLLEK